MTGDPLEFISVEMKLRRNDWAPLRLLENAKGHGIPQKAGAYVLMTRSTWFQYPWGRSRVYWIGQAGSRTGNLKTRIEEHSRHTLSAMEKAEDADIWPRYRYGERFGAIYSFVTAKGRRTGSALEKAVFDAFVCSYGAPPVACTKER